MTGDKHDPPPPGGGGRRSLTEGADTTNVPHPPPPSPTAPPPPGGGGFRRLADAAATDAFGRSLAREVQPGDLIALRGPLGAGKTSLARGLLAGLGLAGEAPSPSFAIVQPYDPPEVRLPVLHVDLYRIDDAGELEELGLTEARRTSLLLVEWPEHGGIDRWPGALVLSLEPLPEGGRILTATVPPAWERRWPT